MHSALPIPPPRRHTNRGNSPSQRWLAAACITVMLAIGSVVWAPTSALGASDRGTPGNAPLPNPSAPPAANSQVAAGALPQYPPRASTAARRTAAASDSVVVAQNTIPQAGKAGVLQRYAQAMNATAVVAAGTIKTAPSVPSVGYRSPGNVHKIYVSDAKLAQSMKAQGGRVVADYGSFVLMEASEAIASGTAGNRNAEIVDENNLVLLNAGSVDTTTPAAQAQSTPSSVGSGKGMRLIQFAGPIRPEWYQALVATGVRIVTYIPNNAYLVYGRGQELQAVQQLATDKAIVQWDGNYTAAHRIDPAIKAPSPKDGAAQGTKARRENLSAKGNEQYNIQMVDDPAENAATLALIEQYKLEPIIKQDRMLGYFNVRVTLPRDVIFSSISQRVDVVSIQPWNTPKKRDERQNIIITGNVSGTPAVPPPTDYLAYLIGKGFNVGGTPTFAVNLSDSGVDNATTTPNHFALYRIGDPSVVSNSRIIYNRLAGTPNTGSTLQGCDGHGNENSHIIGGFVPSGSVGGVNFGAFPHADASGFRYGLGIAPFVKIGSSVIFDPNTFTSPDYASLESQAYNDSARISSNSWGANSNAYTIDAQQYDALVRDAQPSTAPFAAPGNQEYVIVFAAGNAGPGVGSVGEPSTAKNVITVGAAENVNPFSGADGCGIDDTGANDANDLIFFSGRGPTADGRRKPDIVAPGTHVSAGAPQASIVSPAGSGTGAQLACFDAGGVCAGVGSDFFPAGQQWYTASSGTSHSTPAISGVAALIRQHFINLGQPTPSPAMTKGLMMNSARYMTGAGANDTLPSNNQGMGEVSLNSYFDIHATAHSLHDQVAADTFTASGQQRVITGTIADVSKPFRVTLVWTDVPGPTSGSAFVNNLDLEVTVGGNIYKGNVFSGAFSATGGVADTRNNVESVFIPAGISGTFVIKIKATNIAGDGVPGDANPLDQDFALVAYNATELPLPVIASGATTFLSESCSLPNMAIDPAETVTLNFDLTNVGLANTANLVATLQATGGVTAPTGPQNYGAVVAGGASVTRSFGFTASTMCGEPLTATLQLQDGAQNLGTVSFVFRTGALGAPVTRTYSTGNIAVPIPDASSVDIPITIADTGLISDVNVRVRANHTFDADLSFELVGPDGTIVPLAIGRGGSGDNYGTDANDCSGTATTFDDAAAPAIGAGIAPFAGTFRPELPLSAFNGTPIAGTWKLRATDSAALDTGTIGCVQLQITRQRFVCCGVAGTPEIAAGGAPTIIAENYVPPNSAPDPGEMVTVAFPLLNTGDGNTTNLVATLLNSGGITPVTTTQSYGVVLAAGPTVAKPFTFVANGACGSTVTATFHLQDGAVDLGNVTFTLLLGTITTNSVTFSNASPITIPAVGSGAATGAPATPYPSNITVSGATPTISKVTVTLTGFSHSFPADVDLLLVSPTGRKMIILSDIIGGQPAVSVDIALDDGATEPLPSSSMTFASGSYQPANYGTVQDPFPAPAPAGPYLTPITGGSETLTSAFTGASGGDPNGTWSLYAVDDAGTDVGSISGGWSITLTTLTNVCSSPPPLALVAAQTRRTHGAAGTFDVPLALAAGINHNPSTDPRQGPAHTVVFTFNGAITGATVAITEGTAIAGVSTFAGNDVIVPLTGVTDQQYVTVSLTNVTPSGGGALGSAEARVGFLVGDVNQSRVVSLSDVLLVNSQFAQSVTASNFLRDVNASGTLSLADRILTSNSLTHALPPP